MAPAPGASERDIAMLFGRVLVAHLLAVWSALEIALVDNVHRAFWTHDGDLCRRPGIVHIGADVLRGHHAVGSAVGLAGNDGDFRDRGFGESEQKLGSVLDDSAVLLIGA